jgi:hypothetical protein
MIKTIEMTEAIIEAKFAKGASWADISTARLMIKPTCGLWHFRYSE